MFKRNKPDAPHRGRYYVEGVQGRFKDAAAHAAKIQERVDAGDAEGWRLINVTSYGNPGLGSVLLFWDTKSA